MSAFTDLSYNIGPHGKSDGLCGLVLGFQTHKEA
jgi:hypothetical protein